MQEFLRVIAARFKAAWAAVCLADEQSDATAYLAALDQLYLLIGFLTSVQESYAHDKAVCYQAAVMRGGIEIAAEEAFKQAIQFVGPEALTTWLAGVEQRLQVQGDVFVAELQPVQGSA